MLEKELPEKGEKKMNAWAVSLWVLRDLISSNQAGIELADRQKNDPDLVLPIRSTPSVTKGTSTEKRKRARRALVRL
jgi:hypothetical protein